MISQDRPSVERWFRLEDGEWRQRLFDGMDAALALESAPVIVPFVDLYDRVVFTAALS